MMGQCGDNYTKLRRHQPEWLRHATRMADHPLSCICLFGWLTKAQPFHDPKWRWRDIVKSDLQSLGIDDDCWCGTAVVDSVCGSPTGLPIYKLLKRNLCFEHYANIILGERVTELIKSVCVCACVHVCVCVFMSLCLCVYVSLCIHV